MKVVIAPDSFKESLSARHVAEAIAAGLITSDPAVQAVALPMADGGEGTLEAIIQGASGRFFTASVVDALGRPCQARWGWLEPETAVIEMASAAGLEQIAPADRDIMRASTRGVGQLVRHALDHGAKRIILTAGGSATNDAGAGMLVELGLKLLDQDGRHLSPHPQDLQRLARLDDSSLDARVHDVQWVIATDVDNPLCGPQGASAVFGPQKGASSAQVEMLDDILCKFAKLSEQILGQKFKDMAGAGAGGGFGFAALAWLGAHIEPGAQMVAKLIRLESHIKDCDLVITGEGRMDGQTLHGKAPMLVMQIAKRHGKPVVAIAGSLGDGYQALYAHGLTAAFSLVSGPMSLQDACVNAGNLLKQRAVDIMRLIRLSPGVQKAHQRS